MGTWIASEDAIRENVVQILERVTGAGGSVTMPPNYLLGDEDAPAAYRNPEGSWTSARVQAFIQWAASVHGRPFDCPEQVTWHGTIRGMFTARDISCMLTMRGLNLGRYEQVKEQGEVIYRSVKSGSMPPGQPWAPKQITCFRKWLDAGCPVGEPQPMPFHWTPTGAPDASSRYDDIWFLDKDTGWAVNSNGHILHTTDGGDSWNRQFQTPLVNGRPIYLRSVAFATSRRGWAGTISAEQVLFDTEDGGQSWRAVNNLPSDAPVKICGLSIVDENTVWASGTNEPDDPARVMKTTDGGATWQVFDMSANATLLVDIYFFNAERGMVVGGLDRSGKGEPSRSDVQPVILYTDDGGTTWRDRLAATVDEYPRGEWGWKIHWVNDDVGYVSLENVNAGAIAKSVDGGQTWVRLAINDPQTNANLEGVGFIDENRGWVGGWGDDTFTGGFTSATTDAGESWANANEVGAFINRFRFFGDPVHTGYASGRTVYKLTVGALPKSSPPGIPCAKMLTTTQPASFDGPIGIELTIPKGARHAALHVWNQFGRLVRTLVDDESPASGFRHLEWDGDNDGGEGLPGGIYVYRLTVDNDAESRVVRLRRPGT
ncbi:YCF48-related protein [Candidatus Accumulibacter sp. ACC003]|uniref:YCF48-related protein n=1 Tax=Candidatus Accumulibacter sp. ACC003 TaxID=2823334 RepID=UPI0025BBEE2E|nr:YCF48-related protein [Candidatus Accumulibacter sp. ACC003]